MLINLDRKDLTALVKGTSPYYSAFEDKLVKVCGSYTGGMKEEWCWYSSALDELREEDLYHLYLTCKNSWL